MKRRYDVTLGGSTRTIEVEDVGEGRYRVGDASGTRVLEVTGDDHGLNWRDGCSVVRVHVDGETEKLTVTLAGSSIPVQVGVARVAGVGIKPPATAAGPLSVRAPIPGRVAKLLVAEGQSVTPGQGLLVLEAMKMENEIKAGRSGIVQAIRVTEGAAVEAAAELLVLA